MVETKVGVRVAAQTSTQGPGESTDRPVAGAGSLQSIGSRLRSVRLERGIGVREMARRISVSPSFVSQVELGKTQPSVGTLYAFVSELGLSLDDLMVGEGSATPTPLPQWASGAQVPWPSPSQPLLRAANRPRIQLPGVIWERLTSADDAMVEFLRVVYNPGGASCTRENLMRHGGQEYGHIMSGRLNVQVGFETYELGVGDSIHFDSTTPHRLSNDFDDDCESVWVVVGRRLDRRVGAPDHNVVHMPALP